jgi:hypothetical protein
MSRVKEKERSECGVSVEEKPQKNETFTFI